MVFIRKLLSRKFNIVCLNLAGLLTCFMRFNLPISVGQWFRRNRIPF